VGYAGTTVPGLRCRARKRARQLHPGSLRDLRVAEVMKMDMKVEDGKVAAFRTRVSLSFKYEA
jgi:dodecin